VSDALSSNREVGSTTLTLAALHPRSGQLRFYYIGDSLYGLFQERNVVMVHPLSEAFHHPLKLGPLAYSPHHGYSEAYSLDQLHSDDVIVLGSNGLWDNVPLDLLHYHVRGPGSFEDPPAHSKQYPDAVGRAQRESRGVRRIAEKVASIGAIMAKRGNYESPIYLAAQREKVECAKEGFLDDVTVVVAKRRRDIVISRESHSDP
jgi:serine/threonine protein phosphatase PrpC